MEYSNYSCWRSVRDLLLNERGCCSDSLLKLASLGLRQDGLGFVHWLGFLFIFQNPKLGTEA